MDSFSIADFAESLISEEVETKGKEKIQEEDPHDIEVDQAELVNRLQDLISELKGVLTEMTTTGMIGGHVGGLAMRPKKKRILRKKKK